MLQHQFPEKALLASLASHPPFGLLTAVTVPEGALSGSPACVKYKAGGLLRSERALGAGFMDFALQSREHENGGVVFLPRLTSQTTRMESGDGGRFNLQADQAPRFEYNNSTNWLTELLYS